MVGGYFDLPISCSSTSDTEGSKISRPRSFALPIDISQAESTSRERIVSNESPQYRDRNATIPSTNHIQSNDINLEDLSDFMLESRLDRRGELPQRPLSTVNIPDIQGKVSPSSQVAPLLDDDNASGSVEVPNLTISNGANLPNTARRHGNLDTNDKRQTICFAHERAHRFTSLFNNTQKVPKSSHLLPSVATATTGVDFHARDEDIPRVINCYKTQQPFEDSLDGYEAEFLDGRSTGHSPETHCFVQQMSPRDLNFLTRLRPSSPSLDSSHMAPSEDRDPYESAERPSHYRGGFLSSLLKLYNQPHHTYPRDTYHEDSQDRDRHESFRKETTSGWSGRGLSPDSIWRPNRKWYDKSFTRSSISLPGSYHKSASPFAALTRSRSSGAAISGSDDRFRTKHQYDDEVHITVHIAELLCRQRYLIRLCRALMKYGAPTHRLEEYMRMTARVIQIDGQFLYIPGCMIISFDDASTHTTEVKVVRSIQGIDLGKLADVHEIYKEVIHDVIGVEEAIVRLDGVMKKSSKFHILFLIFAHGCASASVGPFAFNARPVDVPVAFLLGCLLGVLQLILSPKSSLYSNVFEISAAVLTSFLARAFGSLKFQGEPLFCFSALAQSAIALILPGYTVLCASLELQSRSIIAGSVRMVYAIIYSLFLGFGITIGTAVYGLFDSQASTDYTCPASPIHNEYLQRFPFVIMFTVCLAIVNRAKWKQMPIMLLISMAGYLVNYFSAKRLYSNTQVSNALSAFVIGVMGNLYSRLRHGLAAAAMLPAIFVLVPSGLAASGSLISGITSAEEMTRSPYAVVNNGTQGFVDAAKNLSVNQARDQNYGFVFDIAYGMVQIAIGTTVGLFLAALVVYPLGKKRSGLFSF